MSLGSRISAAASAVILFSLVFPSCAPSPQLGERTFVDYLGYPVTIQKDVRRIVSLLPSNSEMVCLLDCGRLKGGTRYDRFPEELARRIEERRIEIVGGGFDPSLERIIGIGPDLILVNGPSQQRITLPLKRMGFPVFSLYPKDMDGIRRDFLLLGEILGMEEKARKILVDVEAGLEDFRKRTRGHAKKRVYLQTWPEPMITVGKNSMAQWILELAGGINVFGDMPFDSGKISLEWVVQRDPEVLIFVDSRKEFADTIRKLPGWREIDGVKKNRICFVEAAYLRRTVQFLDGVHRIHRCLFGAVA